MIKLFIILLIQINATLILAQEFDVAQHQIRMGVAMLTEQFKSIKDYEDIYEISNFGRVKSLKRTFWASHHNETKMVCAEKILKGMVDKKGYVNVYLSKKGKSKRFRIHNLVWDHFGDKERDVQILVTDHIDEDKQNNNISNLQLLSNSDNVRKTQLIQKGYTGICFDKKNKTNSWMARYKKNGKQKHLGYFPTKEKAFERFINELKYNGEFNEKLFKKYCSNFNFI